MHLKREPINDWHIIMEVPNWTVYLDFANFRSLESADQMEMKNTKTQEWWWVTMGQWNKSEALLLHIGFSVLNLPRDPSYATKEGGGTCCFSPPFASILKWRSIILSSNARPVKSRRVLDSQVSFKERFVCLTFHVIVEVEKEKRIVHAFSFTTSLLHMKQLIAKGSGENIKTLLWTTGDLYQNQWVLLTYLSMF